MQVLIKSFGLLSIIVALSACGGGGGGGGSATNPTEEVDVAVASSSLTLPSSLEVVTNEAN